MKVLINIDVPDLDAAVRFYSNVFELTISRRLGEDVVELGGSGVSLYMLLKEARTRPIPQSPIERTYERHWTPVHLDFAVDSIENVFDRSIAAGAKTESGIQKTPFGKIALMSDPFGNGFCLIEFNEMGYDAL